MVSPFTVDVDEAPAKAFIAKTEFFHHPQGRSVFRPLELRTSAAGIANTYDDRRRDK